MGLDFDLDLPDLPNNPFAKEAFKTGYIFELIDTRKLAGPIDAHAFVLAPRVYLLSEPFQTTLTPTENDTVIEETNGIIVREITLEGTFGLKERAPAFNVLGSKQGKGTGTEHFIKLRQLFRKYSDLKKSPKDAAHIKLVWHSLKDDDHFIVVPRSFETPRDSRAGRMHYDYRITLAAIGPGDKPFLLPPEDGFSFTDALRAANEGINDARAFLQDVNASIAQIRSKVGNISTLVNNFTSLLDLMSNAISTTNDLVINYPRQSAAAMVDQIEDAADRLEAAVTGSGKSSQEARAAARSLRGMSSALERMMMNPTLFSPASGARRKIEALYSGERGLSEQDLADGTAGATSGSTLRAQYGSEASAGIDLGEQLGMSTVTVDATETLQSLAQKYSTTPEAIILANDLRPPYISPAGIPGTIKPGDRIIVPLPFSEGTETVAPNANYLTPEEALYGVDLAIDMELLRTTGKLDVLVDEVHGSLDAALVRGINNVIQGVTIIMVCEKGENQYVPTVGRQRAIGSRGDAENVLLAAINTRRAVLDDPRISDIDEMRVVIDGDVLKMEITPVVSGFQDGVTLALPFGRTSGD